jgi:hypothetical protein
MNAFQTAYEWLTDPKNGYTIMIVGAFLAQMASLLPASAATARLMNLLHGIFPSPQVMANGTPHSLVIPPPPPPPTGTGPSTRPTMLPPPPAPPPPTAAVWGLGALSFGMLVMLVVIYAVPVLISCSPSTPTPAQQATLGTYEAALQACIARAKLTDGGYASYQACASKVDMTFRSDGGAK